LELHWAGKQIVERGDVGEAARAFESFEKMARFNVGHSLIGMKLEELLAGGGTAQAAQHTKLAIVDGVSGGGQSLDLNIFS
jgi:hypothetical protein